MNAFDQLKQNPTTWLVTGVAGFIGSSLLETLLKLNQQVTGLDNFATGYERNLTEVQSLVSAEQWRRFVFIEGDIRDLDTCRRAAAGCSIHSGIFNVLPSKTSRARVSAKAPTPISHSGSRIATIRRRWSSQAR